MNTLTPLPYYKMYKVPLWFVIANHENTPKVVKWFQKTSAHQVVWPSTNFIDTCNAMKKKGWAHAFPIDRDISAQALSLAFVEHCKEHLNRFAISVPPEGIVARLPRRLATAEDYSKFFNVVLDNVNSVELAQMFQVQERCYANNKERAWFSVAPFDFSTISRLSERTVIIDVPSEGFTPDIDITKLDKGVSKKLEEEMEKFVSLS